VLPDTDAISPATLSFPSGAGDAAVGAELELAAVPPGLCGAARGALLDEPHAATERAVAMVITKMAYRMKFTVDGGTGDDL